MFAPLAPLAPRSCARLGDRSRLLRVPARLKSFPRKSDLELCAGRCKNQWNKLNGKGRYNSASKRAARLEASEAKKAKTSPAAPPKKAAAAPAARPSAPAPAPKKRAKKVVRRSSQPAALPPPARVISRKPSPHKVKKQKQKPKQKLKQKRAPKLTTKVDKLDQWSDLPVPTTTVQEALPPAPAASTITPWEDSNTPPTGSSDSGNFDDLTHGGSFGEAPRAWSDPIQAPPLEVHLEEHEPMDVGPDGQILPWREADSLETPQAELLEQRDQYDAPPPIRLDMEAYAHPNQGLYVHDIQMSPRELSQPQPMQPTTSGLWMPPKYRAQPAPRPFAYPRPVA